MWDGRDHALLVLKANTLGLFVFDFLPEYLMLHNWRSQEEKKEYANEAHPCHDQDIVLLVDISENKCGNQVAENLRAHVEGPEESKIEAFVLLHSAIRDIGTRGWLGNTLP